MVYGPTDEDVWTDELGRVLVKFDWDRTQKGQDGATTSCWLRVVQGWAGPRWGMQFLPRVGEEVLVDFIGGDPDRPIVVGRVYNAVHKPPFELKKYRLQSGIKTRSVPLGEKEKDRFHMLRFDDTHGSEQVLVRSQRRLDIRAFGSTYETTSGNRNAVIGWKDPDSDKQGGDFDITIGNDYQVHVNGGRYERVEKPRNLTVVGQSVSDLESDDALMVKGTANINAAKIILEAKQKISLKVGGNAIVIDPSGVTIIGTIVKINSGGAGEETSNPSIEDPEDAAASDTGEPGWLEKHKGGPGGGRKRRQLNSQHYIAPPRPGEPAAVTRIRNMLNQTPTGRNAMYVYDRDNVQPVIGAPGVGMSYHPDSNTVTVDPASQTPGSSFVHEMNHADAQNSGTTPNINTASRADYVNGNRCRRGAWRSHSPNRHTTSLRRQELLRLGTAIRSRSGLRHGLAERGERLSGGASRRLAERGRRGWSAGRRAGGAESFQSGNVKPAEARPPPVSPVLWQRLGRSTSSAAAEARTLRDRWRRTPAHDIADARSLRVAAGRRAHSAQIAPQQEATMSDRTPLAQLVEPINAEVARLIRDPATIIERLDTPFLRDGLIFRIELARAVQADRADRGLCETGQLHCAAADEHGGVSRAGGEGRRGAGLG